MSVIDIINGAWAIQPVYLETIQRIYMTRREGKISAEELREIEAAVGKPLNNNADKRYEVRGGVAVIPVMGSMVKRGSMFSNVSGMTSYEAIQRDLRQAEADPEVTSGLLNIDSPGGVVNGCATAAEAIRAFAQKKPIGAWTDGMMTSAAQWLGSATGNVYIGNDTTELGSIGVIGRHMDVSKAEEMDGVKTTILTAGKYKSVGNPYAPLSAEHQAVMQDRLDYSYSAFVNAISSYTGTPIDKVLSEMADARIFNGKQAVDVGLAAGMMSFDGMLAMMQEKGNKRTTMPMKGMVVSATGGKATAEIKTEVKRMNRAELKEQNPALYAEIFAEGQAAGGGPMCGTCACKDCTGGSCATCTTNPHTMSVAGERDRISAVLAVPAAGHNDLVQAALIGGSTAEQVSLRILQAEKAQRDQHLIDSAGGSNNPVPAAEKPAEGTEAALALIGAAVSAGSVQ